MSRKLLHQQNYIPSRALLKGPEKEEKCRQVGIVNTSEKHSLMENKVGF